MLERAEPSSAVDGCSAGSATSRSYQPVHATGNPSGERSGSFGSVGPVLNRLDLRGATGDLSSRLPRPEIGGEEPVAAVRAIIAEVVEGGDVALVELTRRLDGVSFDPTAAAPVTVPAAELWAAAERIDPLVRTALEVAAARIEAFHRTQLHGPTRYDSIGVVTSTASPVRRAGCYVPGGRAAYPSTVLMTVIPARVAGVAEIAVCVPPDRSAGAVADVTLAACAIAGATEVHAVGGAQAIAALAHGTTSIPAVDVICGPGNQYVALAKREVAGHVGIASAFAGPSEVVVIADHTAPPAFAAVDVVVQAEHGPDGLAWLICWDPAVADAVDREVEAIVDASPRRDEILSTLRVAGYAVVCDGVDQALAVSDHIAPEHLQLMCEGADALAGRVRNAGAIFCGPWSPASLGDYVAGPSHVLPTDGSARFSSALTVGDFLRHHHVVTFDAAGMAALAPHVEALAAAEGLTTHALSARLRREAVEGGPAAATPVPGGAP